MLIIEPANWPELINNLKYSAYVKIPVNSELVIPSYIYCLSFGFFFYDICQLLEQRQTWHLSSEIKSQRKK